MHLEALRNRQNRAKFLRKAKKEKIITQRLDASQIKTPQNCTAASEK